MDPVSNLIQDIIESDSNFREVFDPSSETFHKGDPTPVPLGGSRVPPSMLAGPEVVVEEEKKEPDDPRYQRVLAVRNYLQEFKKIVAAVCPAVESKLRAQGEKKSEEHKNKVIAEADEKIQAVLGQIREATAKLEEDREYVADFTADINFVLENAGREYHDKEEYGEFMLKVGMFNKKIFKEIQNLLQVLKDIKK